MSSPTLHWNGPRTGACIALAHGAGAPMDTPFMNAIAAGLAAQGMRVARFEFPYMHKRREDGKKRGPDRQPVLLDTWRAVADQLPRPFALGGKSMGGRMASMMVDEVKASALLCLGYPFHPAGKPENLRVDHLADLVTPTLILQGDRDALGSRNEVESYSLAKTIQCEWIPDGDHSFKPRKKSGFTEEQNWQLACELAGSFLLDRLS